MAFSPACRDPLRLWASILGLLREWYPPAICGLVTTIVVDPVECSLWRTRSHVDAELEKVATPAITDKDATCPVVSINRSIRVVAALQDMSPHRVLWRHLPAPRRTMLCIAAYHSRPEQASAAFRMPSCQVSCGDDRRSSTVAQALPMCTFPWSLAGNKLSCNESTEALIS